MEFERPPYQTYTPSDSAYDIFQKDHSGNPIWVETVIGLDQAKKRLLSLSSLSSGEYLVYNPTTGQFMNIAAKQQFA
jgi:hypothetical protein